MEKKIIKYIWMKKTRNSRFLNNNYKNKHIKVFVELRLNKFNIANNTLILNQFKLKKKKIRFISLFFR